MKSLEERKADRKARREENEAERNTSPAIVKETGELTGKAKGKGKAGEGEGKTGNEGKGEGWGNK